MFGKLFLAGGGNAEKSFVVDEIFLENVSTIAYIPLAWEKGPYKSCTTWLKETLEKHKKVTITTINDANKAPELNKFDAIYIGGGNTYKLLKELKEAKLDEKIYHYLQSGGTVYGGSAGAMIFGKTIETSYDKKRNDSQDTSGLNVFNNRDIHCHYKEKHNEQLINYNKLTKRNIVAIPEESAILITEKGAKVIGQKSAYFVVNGKIKECKVGETVI